MDIVHADRMEWGESLTAHRAGNTAHKILFQGEEESPENYLLVLAREKSDFYSPRHRHAWDQVRYCLQGEIPIGPDLKIEAGEIGYFPEGVPYGPQQGGTDRTVLLLQFGGASGLGYLSPAQLQSGHARLRAQGSFEDGIFQRTSGTGEAREDAYEAIWREVTGKPLVYPQPRYKAPVVLRPDAFAWQEVPDTVGIRNKWLGSFTERDVTLELIAIASGCACTAEAAPSHRLMYVTRGEGRCSGEPYAAHTAVRLQPGQSASLAAERATELLAIGIPPL